METPRAAYSGPSRKLVIAFDIGTTFSCVAYALLDPGEVPQIRLVTRYPSNVPNLGSAKVPSILYYDHDGNFRGIENGVDFQDEDGFLKIRWWKLLISGRSTAMKGPMSTQLPKGKTIVDVFADFMGYLFDSTKWFFKASERNGETKWDIVSNSIELVLTHPNGWGGSQQTQLRTATIKAGIVPDNSAGHSRVHFVTEGEAGFSFCVTHTQAGRDLNRGEQALVIDAGAETIDINTYAVLNNRPLQVEELYEPQRLLQGGESVTARARLMAQGKLKGSRFDTPEDLAAISQKFDEGVKRVFWDDKATQYVQFGGPRDTDSKCGVKAGRLILTGTEVSGFFEPSIQSVVDSVRDNFSQRLITNSIAFLTGSFAMSPWFSEQLERRLLGLGLKVCKPDTHTYKAIAIGAVSFYVEHLVAERITQFTYGVSSSILYQPFNPEHAMREEKSYLDPAGNKYIPDHFKTILPRGMEVLGDREVRSSFLCVTDGAPPRQVVQSIIRYTGTPGVPEWMDIGGDKFETLCTIKADLSTAPYQTGQGNAGGTYYTRNFDIVLLVGPTEMKAQIAWIDSATGMEKRSGAVLVLYANPSD